MSAVQQESLVANAADRQQVRDAKTVETRRSNDAKKDLLEVLALNAGRRVFARLIDGCGVFARGHVPGEQVHYLAGRRDIGIELLESIRDTSPESYHQILTGDIR